MQSTVIHDDFAPVGLAGMPLLQVSQPRDRFVRRNVFRELHRFGSPRRLLHLRDAQAGTGRCQGQYPFQWHDGRGFYHRETTGPPAILLPGPFLDPDIPEHGYGFVIVQLQPDGAGFGALGVAIRFRYKLAIQLYTDVITARFDIQRVPVEIMLNAGLGLRKQVDAARTVLVPVVGNLNLVPDMGWCPFGVPLCPLRELRTRRVADGDPAVPSPPQPELEVQIVLAIILLRVKPTLAFGRLGGIPLPYERSVAHHVPESFAHDFAAFNIFSVQQIDPCSGRKRCECDSEVCNENTFAARKHFPILGDLGRLATPALTAGR